jgi:hypothetical protein
MVCHHPTTPATTLCAVHSSPTRLSVQCGGCAAPAKAPEQRRPSRGVSVAVYRLAVRVGGYLLCVGILQFRSVALRVESAAYCFLLSGEPPAPPARPGLTGDVGPVPTSCDGVTVNAADDTQRVIDAHPPGTTFCLAAGTYRLEAPLKPKEGDALIGQQGAVLNGSKVPTGWRKSGDVWSTAGFLRAGPGIHGQCLESVPTCAFTEDVFLDKKRLTRVESRPQ